eukprot:4362474-Ditylum_brightwellii.AAC.1
MQTERSGCAAVGVDGALYVMGGGKASRGTLSSMESLQMSTPPLQTSFGGENASRESLSSMELPQLFTPSTKASITSRLDALEEEAGLENDSSAFKKRIESLEMR